MRSRSASARRRSSVFTELGKLERTGFCDRIAIRTQIGSIRIKTGACSIRALVQQVALLPPLVSALQGGGLPPLADRVLHS
jgi:hypothetical protein